MDKKEADALALKIDKGLKACQFDSGSLVVIHHHDGAVLNYRSAFLYLCEEWVLVFTEHHRTHTYHKEDLSFWRQYDALPVDRIDKDGRVIETHCTLCQKALESPRQVRCLIERTVCEKCYRTYSDSRDS